MKPEEVLLAQRLHHLLDERDPFGYRRRASWRAAAIVIGVAVLLGACVFLA